MEIKDKYLRRYWYKMVEDQVYDEYVDMGYEVTRDYMLGETSICADLYATRDDEKIIVEIITKDKYKPFIMRLYDIAHQLGAELKLISANYVPLTANNGFEGFEMAFTDYLNDINPGEFGQFATHNRVEDILDTEFAGVYVDGLKAEVSGNCTVDLMAWFDNDDPEFEHYVPCKFEVEMEYGKRGWQVTDHKVLDIDTSQLD